MKRLLLTLAGSLLMLAVLLVSRTLLLAPAQISAAAPALPKGLDVQQAAAHLGEAIRFQTISHQLGADNEQLANSRAAFQSLHAWIAKTYPQFSAKAHREIISDSSLLFTWEGRNPTLPPVLLMSHLDVVPVPPGSETLWQQPPFSGALNDGFIWGRGTIDTKGSVVAMLEAAESLISQGFQPERSVLFAFGHDEEVGGMQGNRVIAEQLKKRGVHLDWVADEGGAVTQGLIAGVQANVAMVGIAEKGMVSLALQAKGAGGHSSMPSPFDDTAIGRLSRALQRIGQNPFTDSLQGPTASFLDSIAPAQGFGLRLMLANRWLFGPLVTSSMTKTPSSAAQVHTVISPTLVSGGIKENVLPPDANAVVNLRIHPQDSIASVSEHVSAAVNDPQVTITALPGAIEPSAISNVNGEAYRYFSQTIRDSFGNTLVAPNLTVGGTDSRYYLPLTENVFRFIPIRLGAEDLARFHGNNERISIENLGEAVAFYYRLLNNLPGQSE
jgi:carboxypeptidase PM20D1